jgi:truncated hemoglobin YjbI
MSLVERFGGEPAIDDFVGIFYQMMKDDQQLGRSFQRFNFEILKARTVDFFLADWAGESWDGRPLFEAHASLHITVEMFDVMMKCIRKTLKQMRKSKQVSEEVINAIEKLREPICDPLGKLTASYKKKLADMEAARHDLVQTPMGFSISKSKMEEDERKRARQAALQEKLKAARENRAKGVPGPAAVNPKVPPPATPPPEGPEPSRGKVPKGATRPTPKSARATVQARTAHKTETSTEVPKVASDERRDDVVKNVTEVTAKIPEPAPEPRPQDSSPACALSDGTLTPPPLRNERRVKSGVSVHFAEPEKPRGSSNTSRSLLTPYHACSLCLRAGDDEGEEATVTEY